MNKIIIEVTVHGISRFNVRRQRECWPSIAQVESRFILREKVGFKTHVKVSDTFHSDVFILIFKREPIWYIIIHKQASVLHANVCTLLINWWNFFKNFLGFAKNFTIKSKMTSHTFHYAWHFSDVFRLKRNKKRSSDATDVNLQNKEPLSQASLSNVDQETCSVRCLDCQIDNSLWLATNSVKYAYFEIKTVSTVMQLTRNRK